VVLLVILLMTIVILVDMNLQVCVVILQVTDHVVQNPHMPTLPQSNLSLDILMGRDEMLDTVDFMGGTHKPTASTFLSSF
jgi:hypothetical protein